MRKNKVNLNEEVEVTTKDFLPFLIIDIVVFVGLIVTLILCIIYRKTNVEYLGKTYESLEALKGPGFIISTYSEADCLEAIEHYSTKITLDTVGIVGSIIFLLVSGYGIIDNALTINTIKKAEKEDNK